MLKQSPCSSSRTEVDVADERPRSKATDTSVSSNASCQESENENRDNSNHEQNEGPSRPASRATMSSIRSRPSRRSTLENGQGISEKEERAALEGEEDKGLIRRVPFFRHPVEDAERWHDAVDIPAQWTSLFYGTFRTSQDGLVMSGRVGI